MVPTKRFRQKDGRIYHDCGADEPCRLFPKLLEREVTID